MIRKISGLPCIICLVFLSMCCSCCAKSSKTHHKDSTEVIQTNEAYKFRPPAPNLRKPVNYISWVNDYLSTDCYPDSLAVYDGFWRYTDENGMPDPNEKVKRVLFELVDGPVWKVCQYHSLEEYLKTAAPYIELFKQAAKKPQYCMELKEEFVMPWTASGEYAVQSLLVHAWKEGENHEELLKKAWSVGLKHANHLGNTGVLLSIRRADRIRVLVYQSIITALCSGIISREDCDSIRTTLELTPSLFDITKAVYVEWAAELRVLQKFYMGNEVKKELAQEYGIDIEKLTASTSKPTDLAATVDRYFTEVLALSKSHGNIQTVVKAQDVRNELIISAPVKTNPLVHILLSRIDPVFLDELRALAAYRSVAVILLLHDFYEKNGKWPASLSELKVKEGSKLLIDPFSQGEFIYKATTTSFILYSVGEDQKDNGGTHKNWNWWGVAQEGTDVVFWPVERN